MIAGDTMPAATPFDAVELSRSMQEIQISLARIDERDGARLGEIEKLGQRLGDLESRVRHLDVKLAGALGGVVLIAWGLQLLVPVL